MFTIYFQIIFNPGAFVDVIKCACADTFQAVFPQCVDWYGRSLSPLLHPLTLLKKISFTQTNQTDVLNTDNIPAVVNGIREVCGLGSSIFGSAAIHNGQVTPSITAAPASTQSSRAVSKSFLGLPAAGVLIPPLLFGALIL